MIFWFAIAVLGDFNDGAVAGDAAGRPRGDVGAIFYVREA